MARKNEILGPPPTTGLEALAVATKSKRGKWVWKAIKQTKKQRKLREKWNKAIKKADKRGETSFPWPPKKKKGKK